MNALTTIPNIWRVQVEMEAGGANVDAEPPIRAMATTASPDVLRRARELVAVSRARIQLCEQLLAEATPETRRRLVEAAAEVAEIAALSRHRGDNEDELDAWEQTCLDRLEAVHRRMFGHAGDLRVVTPPDAA